MCRFSSIDPVSPWKNDTWNRGPGAPLHRFVPLLWLPPVFSEIHPTRMKCHFASSHHFRTSHREYFVGGTRAAAPQSVLRSISFTLVLWLSLCTPCSLFFHEFSSFDFEGRAKIVFTLFHALTVSSNSPPFSFFFFFPWNGFGKFQKRGGGGNMYFGASSVDRLVIVFLFFSARGCRRLARLITWCCFSVEYRATPSASRRDAIYVDENSPVNSLASK